MRSARWEKKEREKSDDPLAAELSPSRHHTPLSPPPQPPPPPPCPPTCFTCKSWRQHDLERIRRGKKTLGAREGRGVGLRVAYVSPSSLSDHGAPPRHIPHIPLPPRHSLHPNSPPPPRRLSQPCRVDHPLQTQKKGELPEKFLKKYVVFFLRISSDIANRQGGVLPRSTPIGCTGQAWQNPSADYSGANHVISNEKFPGVSSHADAFQREVMGGRPRRKRETAG